MAIVVEVVGAAGEGLPWLETASAWSAMLLLGFDVMQQDLKSTRIIDKVAHFRRFA